MSGERVEAEFTVPIGVTFEGSNGAQSSETVLTATPGATFISELLLDMQTQLNNNVQGYPTTAAAMQAAVGYGTWTAGWLFNITSGNDTGAFGGVTLTAAGTPVYSIAGPRGGIDLAVGVDAAADQFTGADNFDVDNTQDLCVAWVGKFSAAAAADEFLFVKGNAGAARWGIYRTSAGNLVLELVSASGTKTTSLSVASTIGSWHVGMAVVDRGGNAGRIGICTLGGSPSVSSTTTLFAETMANADNFTVLNRNAGLPATNFQLSAAYIGTGASAASSMSANLSAALTSFAGAINSSFTVSLSTTTGRAMIVNSFWSSYVQFTNSTHRDVLGFEYNFDYPQTAAQMATALGYGTWTTGAGYLCNESSGNLAPVFGSTSLIATSLTYSNLGARGGGDTAVGFSVGTANAAAIAYDVTATDDLCLVALVNLSAAPAAERALLTKFSGTAGWFLQIANSGALHFGAYEGGAQDFLTGDITPPFREWCVVIAALDRATGKACLGLQSLTTGTVAVTALATADPVSYAAGAAAFRMGQRGDGGLSAATESKVGGFYITIGSGVAAGIPANMAAALSNFATYMKSQTATTSPSGVWFPGTSIYADSDPKQAPIGDDKSSSISPTGRVYSMASSEYFRARNVRFPHVDDSRVWASQADVVGADWETFYLETQLAHHDWFEVGSRVRVYWDNGGVVTELGNGNVEAWSMPQCVKLDELPMVVDGFTGLYDIRLGDLYTDE